MFLFHKTPFLVATVSFFFFFLQKNYDSMTLKKAASAKNSANKHLWINIVYGVKIQDTMFILCFGSTSKQLYAKCYRCKVLRY